MNYSSLTRWRGEKQKPKAFNASFQVKVTMLRLHGCRPLHSPTSICSGWAETIHCRRGCVSGCSSNGSSFLWASFPRAVGGSLCLRLFQWISNAATGVTVKLIQQNLGLFLWPAVLTAQVIMFKRHWAFCRKTLFWSCSPEGNKRWMCGVLPFIACMVMTTEHNHARQNRCTTHSYCRNLYHCTALIP